MLGKIVLWVSAVSFIGYGVACLVSPALPAEYAGLGMTNGDAYAEIGAMYGGLQTGFGRVVLLAAIRPALYRAGLTLLVLAIGSLALGRLYSTLTASDPVGGYTYGALCFEFTIALLAGVALRLRPGSS